VWARAFPQSCVVPLASSVFLPWVTMMYALVFPGGITGWEWLWMGQALVAIIAWWAGGRFRRRRPGYTGQY
jgi:hypothetical protein